MKKIKFLILALLGLAFLPNTYAIEENGFYGVRVSFLEGANGLTYSWYNRKGTSFLGCFIQGRSSNSGVVADVDYCPKKSFIAYEGLPDTPTSHNSYSPRNMDGDPSYSLFFKDNQDYLLISVVKVGNKVVPNRMKFVLGGDGTFTQKWSNGDVWVFSKMAGTLYGPIFYDTTNLTEPKVATYFGNSVLKNIVPTWENNGNFLFYDLEQKKLWIFDEDSKDLGYYKRRGDAYNSFGDYVSKASPIGYYDFEINPNEGGYDLLQGLRVKLGAFNQVDENWNKWKNFGTPPVSPNVTTGSASSLAENYNKCFKFYNSIKTYTAYDYNCYKGLLDAAPLTGSYDLVAQLKPWQDIANWNGEGNIAIQTHDISCHGLIRVKREYKEQYKENRDDFLRISSENFFYPHAMDVKAYCGDIPKDEDDFSPSALNSVSDFILGMFEKKGTGTGFNYAEKMEYYREKTLCTLFGWLNDKYCEALNDSNSQNRYIKADIDKGIDNSGGFSSFFSSIRFEFERGKKFFTKGVCANHGIIPEWDILVYLPMIALSLFFVGLLKNVK